MADTHKRFRVALSFAGESRPFVSQVADCLAKELGHDATLYDGFHEAEFARPNLDIHLPNLYRAESELIAIFLCRDYARKRWCNLEWRFIRQLLQTADEDRIMFLSFDDVGAIPELGILSGDGYVSIRARSPSEIADLILRRLGKRPEMAGLPPAAVTLPLKEGHVEAQTLTQLARSMGIAAGVLTANLTALVSRIDAEQRAGLYLRRSAVTLPNKADISDVESWLEARVADRDGSTLTVVLGEYGYGKTSLILRAVRNHAEYLLRGGSGRIPLLARAIPDLVREHTESYVDRLTPALHPDLPRGAVEGILTSGKAVLFIDGVDEVLGSLSQPQRARALRKILHEPLGCNNVVVLTCRTHVFEELGQAHSLVSTYDTRLRDANRTVTVVDELVAAHRGQSEAYKPQSQIVVLCDLSDCDIETYMRHAGCAAEWKKAEVGPGVVDLARRPVLLYLISRIAMSARDHGSEIAMSEQISVSDLYDMAIKTWIRRDCLGCELDEHDVFDLLEAIAMLFWLDVFRVQPHTASSEYLSARATDWKLTVSRLSAVREILERIGLLTRNAPGNMPFVHYSFLEYFLARTLAVRLRELDASLLATLNLVAIYTVNQFLVEQVRPMVLTRTAALDARTFPTTRIENVSVMSRSVTRSEFSHFLVKSGWRSGGALWGFSNTRSAASNIRPLEGLGIEDFDWGVPDPIGLDAVTNVSWYDACLFAKYVGGRLPTPGELAGIATTELDSEWEWTSEWKNHASSLIMVVPPGETRNGGANPDVRDGTIGFRVAWESPGAK
jgi:hypothetical protein